MCSSGGWHSCAGRELRSQDEKPGQGRAKKIYILTRELIMLVRAMPMAQSIVELLEFL